MPAPDQVMHRRWEFGVVVDNVYTFDGAVFEIFGLTQTGSASQQGQRFHRDLMAIEIQSPNHKGNCKVTIRTAGALCQFNVDARDQPVLEFLERVRAALPRA